MNDIPFDAAFLALSGHAPFPWQRDLYGRFLKGDFPASCNLPTGTGKTSVIPIWVLALANRIGQVPIPRRLAYIVNRRTVVDQASDEARQIRDRLLNPDAPPDHAPVLRQLAEALGRVVCDPAGGPLVVSTLRGQLADNGDWRRDPARAAILVGTVDMIGSRLLFSGYRIGFRTRPLHAGLLGQDTLVVHDEAHLSPAFQALLVAVADTQATGPDCGVRPFRVMELTATTRGTGSGQFHLGSEDLRNQEVARRIKADKALRLHTVAAERGAACERIAELLHAHESSGQAILAYTRTPEEVATIRQRLIQLVGKQVAPRTTVLTGTVRGRERDHLVRENRVFARFLPKPQAEPMPGTVYLLCTSAGEVGVNISADHLVCDLMPFDSLTQRFGRVNRFGQGHARIDVVSDLGPEEASKEVKPLDRARRATLAALPQLPTRPDGATDASPHALGELRSQIDLRPAFSPAPRQAPLNGILLDNWALTSVRNELPGRPAVEPWLHGFEEDAVPETYVAWRAEVSFFRAQPDGEDGDSLLDMLADLLEDYPLKSQELLRDRTDRVLRHLKGLARKGGHLPVWLLALDGRLRVLTLQELAQEAGDALAYRTVVLPPEAGGLTEDGLLDGSESVAEGRAYDVADAVPGEPERPRVRFLGQPGEVGWDWQLVGTGPPFDALPGGDARLPGMKRVRDVVLRDGEGEPRARFAAFLRPQGVEGDGAASWAARQDQLLDEHLGLAEAVATRVADGLGLTGAQRRALVLAARWHDRGKDRPLWQRAVGNHRLVPALAKTAHGRPPENLSHYRHEFGSLVDVTRDPDFLREPAEVQDLVLHLIAAHHGRARPHFSPDEGYDPHADESVTAAVRAEVPRRFGRLQRRYGRWGLAWLESLLRAADYLASENPREVPL